MIARAINCLCCLWLLPSAIVTAQSDVPPSADSSAIRFIGEFTLERLAGSIASAANREDQRWWRISVPQNSDSLIWNQLKRDLRVALRARDSLPGDSTRGSLSVSHVRLNATGDSLWFGIEIGGDHFCGGQWWENTRRTLYAASREGARWADEVKEVGVLMSESFSCMLKRSIQR